MTHHRWLAALLLIAVSPYANWARAENVYKCGSSYSQTPCPGGALLEVDDARDPAEKARMDAQTLRAADLARDMEQRRLANEAALAAERAQQAPSRTQPKERHQQTQITTTGPVLVVARKPRLNRPHKPKGFMAVVPDKSPKPKKPRKKLPDGAR